MSNLTKLFKSRLAVLVVIMVTLIGVIALALSHAATGTAPSAEAELGTLSAGAVSTLDATASGGRAVTFSAPRQPTSTGAWISGQSNTINTQDGSFAAWRGRAVEIGGTWAAQDSAANQHDSPSWSIGPGTPYANVPRIDYASGGPLDGETWGQAASGAFDSRWASQLQYMKQMWGSRPAGNMYIRFSHEFNGNWYPWSVSTANVTNFKAAWIRYYNLIQTNFPGAKLVWCPNAGSSWSYGSGMAGGVANLWPGDAYVNVVGVDSYNRDPWVNNQSDWNTKINGSEGLETYREFALAHNKPLAISEWSNASLSAGGSPGTGGLAGGDAPNFFQYFHDWLSANGGTGAGNVLYEVLFNVPGYADHYEMYIDGQQNPREPLSDALYRSLW